MTERDRDVFDMYCQFIEGDTTVEGRPLGKNRRRARSAIREVIQTKIFPGADRVLILHLVDLAYPFGNRPSRWSRAGSTEYKAWLKERQILVRAIAGKQGDPTTEEEFEAWKIACDIVEQADDIVMHGGNADALYDQAMTVLEEQVPHRLNRQCMACGAMPALDCKETIIPGLPYIKKGRLQSPCKNVTLRVDRLLPHMSRVLPPAQSPATPEQTSLPLFEKAELTNRELAGE